MNRIRKLKFLRRRIKKRKKEKERIFNMYHLLGGFHERTEKSKFFFSSLKLGILDLSMYVHCSV